MTTTARNFIAQLTLFRNDMSALWQSWSEYRLPQNRQMIVGTGIIFALALLLVLNDGILAPLSALGLALLFVSTLMRVQAGEYTNSPLSIGIGRGLMFVALFGAFRVCLDWVLLVGTL